MISLVLYCLTLGMIKDALIQKKETNRKYKIIGFKDEINVEEGGSILKSHNIKIKKFLPLANACLCELSEKTQTFENLAADDDVEFIEEDYIAQIQVLPSTTRSYNIQSQSIPWGIQRVEAPKVWETCRGKDVKVGIIDTGVQQSHPDLQDNIKSIQGVMDNEKVNDDNGHGTHVAGIIAALDNNIGVVGVAPDVQIYSVKTFDHNGRGRVSDIIDALNWCVENQVNIVNMSFGISMKSIALERAVRAANNRNIILVAASGNSGGKDSVLYPAKYSEVIAVAASDVDDKAAQFSSGGPEINIIAPGVNITSTYNDKGYKPLSGTSMACPHVTGACALLMSVSKANAENVKSAILNTAKDIGLPKEMQGAGLVSASAAVSNIKKSKGGFLSE